MVRRPTQTSFTFLSVICFPMFPQKMMSWANSYVLLCECASYGSKKSQSHRALNKIVSCYSRQTHSKKLSPQIIYSKDPNMAQVFDAA